MGLMVEVAGGVNDVCQEAINDALEYIANNGDV